MSWRWVAELAGGWALLIVALPNGPISPERPLRRSARWAAATVSTAAIAGAVHLGPQPGREVAAGVATVVASVAFLGFRWVPFAARDVQALLGDLTVVRPQHPPITMLQAGLMAAGPAAAIAAAVANRKHHLEGLLLWLVSLFLFAAAFWERRAAHHEAVSASSWTSDGGPQLSPHAARIALALVIILAAVLRVTLLKDLPWMIDPDEGRLGRYAEKIWQPGFANAFDVGWNVFPHLSYMVEYAGVALLGTSNANLRLSAAAVGTLSIIPLYFWARCWWGNVIALLAAFLMAINREHIAWSRLALLNIQQVLVAALMLAAFARVLRTRRWVDWVWFGYATGLGFHTYHAAKLFPALLFGAALVFTVGIHGFLRQYAAGAVVGAVAFALCCGPLLVTMYEKWGMFYASISNRSDVGILVAAYRRVDVAGTRNYLWSHVGGCLFSFTAIPRQGATFDPFVAVPFMLGVGWMLWRWRDPRHLLILAWTIGILVIGGMMTDYPPSKARLLGLLPTICTIPAVVVGRLRRLLHDWTTRSAEVVALSALLAWLGAALHFNWKTEFVLRPSSQRVDLMTEMYRVIDATRLPATFYLARGGADVVDLKVTLNDCMVAPNPERHLVNLSNDSAIVPVPPTNSGTAVLLLSRYQRELLPLVRHYYPDARYYVVYDANDGGPVLYTVTLSAEHLAHSRGLRATYRTPTGSGASDLPTSDFRPPHGVGFPADVSWRGLVWAPEPGRYAFRATSATVSVDGERVTDSEQGLPLAAGWHAIVLDARFDFGQGRTALEWQTPHAANWQPVPRDFLDAHPEAHGLLGRFFNRPTGAGARPIEEAADYARVDGVVDFDWDGQWDDPPPPPFAARPSTMEWSGTVEIPEGGATLRLEATTPTQVFLNGALVLASSGGRDARPVDAQLPGLRDEVPILVHSVRPANDESRYWKLRLLWHDAAGAWTAFGRYHPPPLYAIEHAGQPRPGDSARPPETRSERGERVHVSPSIRSFSRKE